MKTELVFAYTVMQPRIMNLLEKSESSLGFILRELAIQIIDLEKVLSQYEEIVGDGSSVDWNREDVQCLREEIKDCGEMLNDLGGHELMVIVCDPIVYHKSYGRVSHQLEFNLGRHRNLDEVICTITTDLTSATLQQMNIVIMFLDNCI